MLKHPLSATLSAFLFAAIQGVVFAQCDTNRDNTETARGVVYADRNNNGAQDAGESGLASIPVSNGCAVVLTQQDGSYAVDIAPHEILFISKPAGYATPLDENNIPQFFYRHYPEGTPSVIQRTSIEWAFPVVEATGPLPASIDFPLIPDSSDEQDFTAHGFADTQARFELSQDMLREDLINPLIGNPYSVDFGLTVGDVANDNLAIYDRHKAMMGLMEIPQWYVPGNHDMNFASPNAYYANETYKRHFGPTYYSFDHGQAHFVALNNVEYAGAGNEFASGHYRGFITDNQLQWLENDLQFVDQDKLIVIMTHIPLVAEASDGQSPLATGPNTENFNRLLSILAPFSNIYGLAGHDTSNSWKVEINHQHGWSGQPWIAHTLAEVRGNGWTRGPADLRGVRDAMMEDGNPNGFYVLHFDEVDLTPEFIPFPFGPDANQRLRIMLDPLLTHTEGESINRGQMTEDTKLVVNLFDGGVRDTVWYSLDGGPEIAMQYTVRTDPYVERAVIRYAETDSAYGRTTRSSHIWQADLPDTLEPGIHSVIVTSEDEFGQRQRGSLSFEILD
ncbi:MAG: calcineurin-like phosphoesterase C-terminal domain-containing protein [Pseudomonadales bacterium]|nr:calcineurin-like phosphoesterase C-terminal domain-containing protein [Pseudomonadales bacterium]